MDRKFAKRKSSVKSRNALRKTNRLFRSVPAPTNQAALISYFISECGIPSAARLSNDLTAMQFVNRAFISGEIQRTYGNSLMRHLADQVAHHPSAIQRKTKDLSCISAFVDDELHSLVNEYNECKLNENQPEQLLKHLEILGKIRLRLNNSCCYWIMRIVSDNVNQKYILNDCAIKEWDLVQQQFFKACDREGDKSLFTKYNKMLIRYGLPYPQFVNRVNIDLFLKNVFKSWSAKRELSRDDIYCMMIKSGRTDPLIDPEIRSQKYNRDLANTVFKYYTPENLYIQPASAHADVKIVDDPGDTLYGFQILHNRPKKYSEIAGAGFLHLLNDINTNILSDRLYISLSSPEAALRMLTWLLEHILADDKYENITNAKIGFFYYIDMRVDNIIIYTNGIETSEDIAEQILKYQKSNIDDFCKIVPPMTAELGPGLSRGAEPRKTTGENRASFCSKRADLMSQAFIELRSCPDQTFNTFRKIVIDKFIKNQIDPDDPSRNLP
jgi:hypothetical protein